MITWGTRTNAFEYPHWGNFELSLKKGDILVKFRYIYNGGI